VQRLPAAPLRLNDQGAFHTGRRSRFGAQGCGRAADIPDMTRHGPLRSLWSPVALCLRRAGELPAIGDRRQLAAMACGLLAAAVNVPGPTVASLPLVALVFVLSLMADRQREPTLEEDATPTPARAPGVGRTRLPARVAFACMVIAALAVLGPRAMSRRRLI
jgi:hypothetical protein